ncbi:hypothetical protein PVA38_11165 [Streptococcus pneumoniae D39]|nr:hypothetical protein PVA38_11165 [Streptococcus pneumoniae D39]
MRHESASSIIPVSYTHLRAHETVLDLVCRLLLEKKNFHTIHIDCFRYFSSPSVLSYMSASTYYFCLLLFIILYTTNR